MYGLVVMMKYLFSGNYILPIADAQHLQMHSSSNKYINKEGIDKVQRGVLLGLPALATDHFL